MPPSCPGGRRCKGAVHGKRAGGVDTKHGTLCSAARLPAMSSMRQSSSVAAIDRHRPAPSAQRRGVAGVAGAAAHQRLRGQGRGVGAGHRQVTLPGQRGQAAQRRGNPRGVAGAGWTSRAALRVQPPTAPRICFETVAQAGLEVYAATPAKYVAANVVVAADAICTAVGPASAPPTETAAARKGD